MNFGLNLYNDVMYFEQIMLCSERITCEFQGAFPHDGFKIRYAFSVLRARGAVFSRRSVLRRGMRRVRRGRQPNIIPTTTTNTFMKKTLIALACLSSCALAGTYTYTADSFSSTGAGNNASSLTLTETLTCDGTVNWTISGTFTVGSTASNTYGVALLASTTNPFADTYSGGFQFYLANGTEQTTNKDKFQVKLNNTNKNTYALTQSSITSGDTVSYTLAYAADTSTLTVTLEFTDTEGNTSTQTASTTMASNASISALSTSAAGLEGWTFGDITVTVTSAVPEPATATLGLLALGALALRRRRA